MMTTDETRLKVPCTYAIFSARYAPLTGGVESFTRRLAHQLVAQGDEVLVVTSAVGSCALHEVQEDGVEVYRLPSRQLLGGRFPLPRRDRRYRQMLDEIAGRGIERVLVNTRFYPHSLEGVRFAKQICAPVVVLDHGSAHLTFGNSALDWFVQRYEHAITGRAKALDPVFAGISRASVQWLRHFGITTDIVIPNAIDAQEFRTIASDRDYRRELQLATGQRLVAFVGRLEPEKGALVFAEAAAACGGGYAFAMAGDGRQRDAIDEFGQTNLALLGQLSQPDLSALLRDADVFCLPTRSEGFCTSLLEAAAQGAIPVMPHVGGTDEVMGYDPVRFGVICEDVDVPNVAEAMRAASALVDSQASELKAHVEHECTWEKTVAALEGAFAGAF